MKLVLFRHGLAVDRDKFLKQKKPDSLRPLLPKGRQKTLMMAKKLQEWEPDFDLIVSSPFLRAKQTTRILSKTLRTTNVFESPELIPSAPPLAFMEWLRVHAEECQLVLVVGHEPHLSTFASWCLTGHKDNFVELKKSGMMALELKSFSNFSPGTAQLLWHVSPRLFEKD